MVEPVRKTSFLYILKYTDGKIQQRDNKTSHRCHEDSETRVFYVSTAHSVRAPT